MKFKDLFLRKPTPVHPKEDVLTPNQIEFYDASNLIDMEQMTKCIKELEEILDITAPKIVFVPYSADWEGNNIVLDGFEPKIPLENYKLGYYDPTNEDTTLTVCVYDFYTQELLSLSELVFSVAHELRHTWQFTHKRETYFSTQNALGAMECVLDASEIDADAFAQAYTKHKGLYNKECQLMQYEFMRLDGGQRKKRALMLQGAYFSKK